MIRRLKRRLGDVLYPSTPIWDGEWDVCLILDGCRADSLQEVYPEAGSAVSVASSSKRWMQRTFDGHDTSGVGLITANPFAHGLDPGDFAYLERVPIREVESIETAPPVDLRDRAIQAWRNRHQNGIERLVVHFMQPHVPFRSRPEWFSDFRDTDTWGHVRWRDVGTLIGREEWMAAYHDNLEWVVEDAIVPLRSNLDADVLVTADHGNACGEWGAWGHPTGSLSPAVRMVPWYEFTATDLKEIHPEVGEASTWSVETQLDALGYGEVRR